MKLPVKVPISPATVMVGRSLLPEAGSGMHCRVVLEVQPVVTHTLTPRIMVGVVLALAKLRPEIVT